MKTLIKGGPDWHADVNENFEEVGSQLSEKVNQSALDTTNANVALKANEIDSNRTTNSKNVTGAINELDSKKVDKNGSGQITLEMLSQGVKDTITGQAPLTNVGTGGVLVYDLSDDLIKNMTNRTPISFTKITGGYINPTGTLTSWSGFSYAEIDTLIEGELIHWVGTIKGSLVYGVIFVGSSNNIIQKNFVGNDTGGIAYDSYIRVPVGTVKAYFNFSNDKQVDVYNYKNESLVKESELVAETQRAKYEETHIEPSSLIDATMVYTDTADNIILTSSNTEILTGKIYTGTGGFQVNAGYDTLYYPVGKYKSFLLSNYPVGTFGGAFVKQDKTWISSFATDGVNANVLKVVPTGAYYIAISVSTSNRYKTISGNYINTTYKLNQLTIDLTQINGNIAKTNQWFGKKVVWIGTSVSFGQYAIKSYAQECSNKLGFNLVNASVPGEAIHMNSNGTSLTYGSTCMSIAEYQAEGKITIESTPVAYSPGGSYNDYYRTWENIFTTENADADLWVFDVAPDNNNFSTTDWDAFDKSNWRYTDGSAFDSHRTTFLGALLFLMDKMYALNPNARMVLVLGSAFAYSEGQTAFNKLKSQWNIPIIDIWGKINTSPKSLLQVYSQNGTNTHPSTFGHEKLGNIITNELLLIS